MFSPQPNHDLRSDLPRPKSIRDIVLDAVVDIANYVSMKVTFRNGLPADSFPQPLGGSIRQTKSTRMLIGFHRVEQSMINIMKGAEHEEFTDSIVQPGKTAYFMTRTQVLFKPEGISVKAAWANSEEEGTKLKPDPVDWLMVSDVKVGTNSQHPTADAIPARTYNALFENGRSIRLDTCAISMIMSVMIHNSSPRPIEIEVSMVGDVPSTDA